VYQYILKVKISSLSKESFLLNNASKMNLDYSDMSTELRIIKRNRLINKFLSIGSKQRKVVKSLYALLTKRKQLLIQNIQLLFQREMAVST
jgi:hypothetical protein